ncbi:hypothetical protein Taro_048083 [Colocasia esculenta]|uniref:Sulfite exporter TauE/SafE family protein n=1 Tax=Colocasia esculenta TaxID=4460 RepID=A0A843X767_COLES|nr:hypothetical protein [Colocasia esculenta]
MYLTSVCIRLSLIAHPIFSDSLVCEVGNQMRRKSSSFSAPAWVVVLLPMAMAAISHLATADQLQPTSQPPNLHPLLQWRANLRLPEGSEPRLDLRTAVAAVLCLVAAAISSAGGIGGGSLFLPILNLVAGMDLKMASPFTAFLVTGGAAANVLYNILFGAAFIDYDVALLSEPCMLLGVTVGVICNVVFPGWLVTLLFALVIAWSTYKTCRAGMRCWQEESLVASRACEVGFGERGKEAAEGDEEGGRKGVEEPLLGREATGGGGPSLRKVFQLLLIWVCFFVMQFLRGDKAGKCRTVEDHVMIAAALKHHLQGVIRLRRCGVGYWLITFSQVPLALLFTGYILYEKGVQQAQQISLQDDIKVPVEQTRTKALRNIIFPIAALLSGLLGGLFGIGGGLFINPVLLQIGLPPQITAATCCFMVLFSSTMSSFQYLMLGMKCITQASLMAMFCSVASLVGIVVIQRAVVKYGRASLIIFSVSMVMVLSTVSITCFGAVDVWKDYIDGKEMGFKLLC